MVVDTSAAMAALTNEPTAGSIRVALERRGSSVMSAATLVELSMVFEGRVGSAAPARLARFLREARIDVVPVDRAHADRAVEGWQRFGNGRHRAALNLGDCFTYGLAATTGYPVLCVGNDFAQTDVDVVPLT
ncbi:MAG: type II toxin-antitoxin system VapC family toxin [Sporichthyaceae bacterium]